MWPQALQMTRDECRGVLRRLELESYSHVISVFRAQGGLSENKAKLLEELRGIFHISQERHRAEARRVANDEQLCTIAEAISGPNTWQEWSREGRRSYPMLPRVAPQTALALIANNVATETASENAKLPYPADTAAAVASENANTNNAISVRESAVTPWEVKPDGYVVTDDPFKMPDIPSGNKKNLKRNISDSHTVSNKKRIVSDISPSKQQQQQKQFHHITANSSQVTSPGSGGGGASNIRKLYHNHNISKASQNRVNQPQTPQKTKLATKKSTVAAAAAASTGGAVLPGTPGKRQATPARSGRKSNAKIQEQKHLQLLQQQQQQQILAQSQQQQLLPQTGNRNIPHTVGEIVDEFSNESKYAQPHIAASKKDITKNLTKLQLPNVMTSPTPTATAVSPTMFTPSMMASSNNTSSSRIEAHQLSTNISPSTFGGSGVGINLPIVHSKTEKQLISTPVQKIIIEDRLPPQQNTSMLSASAVVVSTASVSSSNPSLQTQSTSPHPQQVMTLPQISAAATKLRAINTTMLPPGTKLTTKKMPPNSAVINTSSVGLGVLGNENQAILSNQAQVFNIIEANNNSSSNVQITPAAPSHTPPAIIQLQSTNSSSVSQEGALHSAPQPQQPVQGKVLTTKLLPVVLGGSGSNIGVTGSGANINSNISGGNTVNITKIETLNNGATLVSGLGGNNANTSSVGTATMIKNMGSTLLLSPNQNAGTTGNTIFSSLASGASVFRKSQIIKAGTIGISTSSTGKVSGTFTTSNTGPQIISNIKLTPANPVTNVSSMSHSNQQQHQHPTTGSPFLQHQLKNISTGLRASVKICASANGKVFIQSSDGNAKGKLHGTLSHKILPNAVVNSGSSGNAGASGVGGSGNAGSTSHTPHQRVSIQKVQIFPASGNLTGPFHTTHINPATSQSHAQSKSVNTTNALTLGGNKGNMNMVFVPSAGGGRTTSGTITLSKSATNKIQQQSIQTPESSKPNVVIIGSSSAQGSLNTPIKATTFIDSSKKYNMNTTSSIASGGGGGGNTIHLERNQMITEDTPVDILNMPIIVDSGDGTNITMGNNIGDTVTVLPTSLVENAEQQQQQPSTIILGATDWEMELDQATAVAAATKAAARSDNNGNHKQQQQQDKESTDGETIIIDDSFEDVIVEEQEEGDTDAGAETEGTIDGETGGEEGQEMSEKAYTIFSGNESEGEMSLMTKQREVTKGTGRLQKTYTNNSNTNIYIATTTTTTSTAAASHDDEEPIEVIDDDDKNLKVTKSEMPAVAETVADITAQKAALNEKQKNKNEEINKVIVNKERANNNTTTAAVECETDAGFDETIVADIDENTAIEYIEEDNNTNVTPKTMLHKTDKLEKMEKVNEVSTSATSAKITKKQSGIIVLDDNDDAAPSNTMIPIATPPTTLVTTAPLIEAGVATATTMDSMGDVVMLESETSTHLPMALNAATIKPLANVAAISSGGADTSESLE